eukprot:CAMPEP_0113550658 /NCGR_PEP_ID=MMETSP0015_2-20120614/14103_1 /TAXON_ID=2838 /ORGANISM="Odontella" /LENGTH=284 /DNA_ID=CAMNT_0000451487 /DNA_START=792 /DNA_END=1646 /DNA_ORIENTATION=+ /assembly_acc=CAM_ASM_000160
MSGTSPPVYGELSPGTAALVMYLRAEADAAEERAKKLRSRAQMMAHEMGMSQAAFDATIAEASLDDASEMAPVDEWGVPKYKGKKRGRKPKKRKRVRKPDTPKRQHTGYTLFMQENYPAVKEANPALQSKDIIGIVAKQWANVDPDVKTAWKERAKAINEQARAVAEVAGGGRLGLPGNVAAVDGGDDDEEKENEDDDEDEDEGDEVGMPSLDHGVPAEEVAAAAAAAGAVAVGVSHVHDEEEEEEEEGTGDEDAEDDTTPWSKNKSEKRGANATSAAANSASV